MMINRTLLEKMYGRALAIDVLRRGQAGICPDVETLSREEWKAVDGLHRLRYLRLELDDTGNVARPLVYRTSVDGLKACRLLERAPDRAPIAGSGTTRRVT